MLRKVGNRSDPSGRQLAHLFPRVEAAQHGRAKAWLDDRLNGTAPVGLPWPSLLAFLRLVTNPRAFERPETSNEV
jgi:predicted nucleic acid-binding protein